jgi:4-amino-4-deoxy-L-arabinose transferase-like glycosyltransferase
MSNNPSHSTFVEGPAKRSAHRFSPLVVSWPALLVAGLMIAALLAVAGAYGFHRDELYFIVAGRHPAFGYPDQPPLTPLLSAASVALFGLSPTAVRVLPALAMGLVVVLTALVAGDLGGSRRAQVLAAVTVALSGYLAAGHFDATATYDLLFWAVILWLVVRLLAGSDRRLWLAVGVAAGIGLENKDTLLLLFAGLGVGLVLARRWDVLRSPWAWAAAGIALVIWAPNLAWQATHGLPQFTMARVIAGDAAANRAQLVTVLWLFTGPLLFLVTVAGWAWMLVAKAAAPWRAVAVAAVVVLVLVVASGGKGYYALGVAPPLMAAGALLLDRWLARGRRRLRVVGFVAAAALSGALVALLTLPILPVATFASTSLPSSVPTSAEQIGWPQLVAQVQQVVAALPAQERAHAVILTNNYGEAAALDLLGKGLPPIYSGHNGFWYWGPPPAGRTVVVHVGDWTVADWSPFFGGCRTVAHIDNGLGIKNQEQGQAISVCRGLRKPWTAIWPRLRHLS